MKYAKEQHIIPKYHLRFFSDDGKTLYLYDLDKQIARGRVSIRSLFKKKNVYERRDENGDFIERNRVEIAIGPRERKYSKLVNKLENRAKEYFRENNQSLFLSRTEAWNLLGMLAVQFFRSNTIQQRIIDGGSKENLIWSFFVSKYSSDVLQDWILRLCMAPRNQKLPKGDFIPIPILPALMRIMLMGCACSIGYTEKGNIITGEHPYYLPHGDLSLRNVDSKIGVIVYPLTTNMVMCLHPMKFRYHRHLRLFVLSDSEVSEVNARMAKNSKLICSKRELTDNELEELENHYQNYQQKKLTGKDEKMASILCERIF